MISAKEARAMMPDWDKVLEEATKHAACCIESAAKAGDEYCIVTFAKPAGAAAAAEALVALGYTVDRLESTANTLRISW